MLSDFDHAFGSLCFLYNIPGKLCILLGALVMKGTKVLTLGAVGMITVGTHAGR